MDKYEKKPLKTGAKALVQMFFQSANKVTAPLISRWPQLGLPLTILVAELNFKLLYHQEELNSFVESLMKDLDTDKPPMDFESKEFTQLLTIAVEQYFTLLLEEKRRVAQKIFLECVKSPNPPQFPLERLNNTLHLISYEGLQFLAFLEKEIEPLRKVEISRKLDLSILPPLPIGEGIEWWQAKYEQTEPLSPYIDKWLNEIYNPPELGHETQAIAEKKEKLKQLKKDTIAENVIEFEQLGLIRSYVDSTNTIGGGINVYGLTTFGRAFKALASNSKV